MGYEAYDPYAGRGLFVEGLRLVLNLAFAPETAGGMDLHRVAAAVQRGNLSSAGLLRSLGFQREGFSPRMLRPPGEGGNHAWQDHVSYVVRREDWPTEPYATAPGRKVVVLVNGVPGSGKATLARKLAAELRIPLFSKDVIKESVADALWALLEDSPVGGVVEGLQRCGLDPTTVPEVWCFSEQVQASVRPLGFGPTVAVDTGQDVVRGDIVRIALQVLAGGLLPASETSMKVP